MKNTSYLARVAAAVLLSLAAVSEVSAQTGARYLIITHDNFYDAVQPLAEWKQQKGLRCAVVKTSQTGSTNAQIRSYIIDAYNTWNPQPEFVLLVGSPALIPAFSHGRQQYRIYSDNDYGNVFGDFMADLPYGRLPCKNARQCSTMVNKILQYERYPDMADTLWFRRATGVLRDAGDDDAYTYWSDLRFTAGLLTGAGITAVESICSSRGQNRTHVVNAVDNGTGFILFRGTATVNWYTPFDVNPSLVNNGRRLPVVCSFTCETVTLSSYDTMIGDAWLKVGTPTMPQGAVAFIGNTHSASNVAGKRSAMTRGFFTGLVSDSLHSLGWAMLRGKKQIWDQYRDSIEYHGFNLLGDPALEAWTATPQVLTVTYDSFLPVGLDSFRVTVTRAGQPLANALVCVQGLDDNIYRYGYTNASGQVELVFSSTIESALHVTVTRHNCLPFEGEVWVGATGVMESPVSNRRPDEVRLVLAPNPGHGLVRVSAPAGADIRVFSATGALLRQLRAGTGIGVLDVRGLAAGAYIVRAESPQGVSSAVLRIAK